MVECVDCAEGVTVDRSFKCGHNSARVFSAALLAGLVIALISCMLFCLSDLSVACAEEQDLYLVDIPQSITVGESEILQLEYRIALNATGKMRLECSDPDAMQYLSNPTVNSDELYYYNQFIISMQSKGEYTLSFIVDDAYRYDVAVTVADRATGVHPASDPFVLRVGEKAATAFELEGGVLYGALSVTTNNNVARFNSSYTQITGRKPGYATAKIYSGPHIVDEFGILVLDESENVKLTAETVYCTVGINSLLTVTDGAGEAVCAWIEIVEGAEHASIYRNEKNAWLKPESAGEVTLKALGTDGSFDILHCHISEMPSSMHVEMTSDTVAAGGTIQFSVTFPEGTWAPVKYYFISQTPAQSGVTGPVAWIDENGVLTGRMAGTCLVQVNGGSLRENFTVTITDSAEGLRIAWPEQGFDWRVGSRITVQNDSGSIAATYSVDNKHFKVDENGNLTADRKGSTTVTVQLENADTYTFMVKAVEYPAWLQPAADVITLPLDQTASMCNVTADISLSKNNDLVLCSSDESVVYANNWQLTPRSVGTAVVTVWSRYCDVHCSVAVVVTEPSGRLYVNGTPDVETMDVPWQGTVDLPTVTDCLGNPVKVTWKITYEYITSGNPYQHCVSLVGSNRVRGIWMDGNAELIATSATGSTFRLDVSPYRRAETCSFRESEYTVTTGSRQQVDFNYIDSVHEAMLSQGDVTFTVTGDTDCVLVEPGFGYYGFIGLKEGTVTLTAKLYNGYTATAVVHVVLPNCCENGHDPEWAVKTAATLTKNGVCELRCSRCKVPLGEEEVIPCTGALRFAYPDVYLTPDGYGAVTELVATLNGSKKQSFTYSVEDTDVAVIVGSMIIANHPGVTTATVTYGDCPPATCQVHVIQASMLSLPDSLTQIEDGAFRGIAATGVRVSDQVAQIGSGAFASCPYLTEAIIPASVTSIADDAFAGSPWVTIVCPSDSYAASWADRHGILRGE